MITVRPIIIKQTKFINIFILLSIFAVVITNMNPYD